MNCILHKRIGYMLLFFAIIYFGVINLGLCGEFVNKQRSLSLEDAPPPQKQYSIPDSPAQETASESVYNDFEQKTKKLSPDEKNKIKNAFKQKLNDAQKGERWDEVSYYGKLIEILEKTK